MMRGLRDNLRSYLQPAFLICVLVLGSAGAGMSFTMKKLGVVLRKEPLPLKKSLELLDEENLSPYQVVPPKRKIENSEVLQALGTQDYIQWVLDDTEQNASSPVKTFLLFITYYPLPDRVPHVPEECWTGSGYPELESEYVTLHVVGSPDFEATVPAKYLVFGPRASNLWQSSVRIPNLYFFKVNGEYAGGREDARLALNKNLFGRHSYFSKVEVVFNTGAVPPTKEEAVAAGQKLLAVILPILEKKHWPDWESGNVSR